ncbi:MAG TPA: hypothetical protein VF759_11670 [Allosphingosinicella sp.]|jgi:uncharacterized membrane protein
MMKTFLVAAGGLLLATANSPPAAEGELSSVVAAPAPAKEEAAVPAAKTHKPHKAAKPHRAAHSAYSARADYPRCSATVRDRCIQGRSRVAAPRHREMQLAMRAGERG